LPGVLLPQRAVHGVGFAGLPRALATVHFFSIDSFTPNAKFPTPSSHVFSFLRAFLPTLPEEQRHVLFQPAALSPSESRPSSPPHSQLGVADFLPPLALVSVHSVSPFSFLGYNRLWNPPFSWIEPPPPPKTHGSFPARDERTFLLFKASFHQLLSYSPLFVRG